MSTRPGKYYTYLIDRAHRQAEEVESTDSPYLDLVAPAVRHESSRDIDEMYEELSIKVTTP